MKYKVGDRVKIKSLDWYNANRDEYGYVDCGSRDFSPKMSDLCGKIATIKEICKTYCYHLEEYDFDWTDKMIECKVEDTITTNEQLFEPSNISLEKEMEWNLPEGYQFKDENGNVISASKIVLEKKKKEYPKTYTECCEMLNIDSGCLLASYDIGLWKDELFSSLQKLLICRDAYWKIAGEEMGLGKPWESDSDTEVYNIYRFRDNIYNSCSFCVGNCNILEFPTEEMRDAFYENFKELIESVKELL